MPKYALAALLMSSCFAVKGQFVVSPTTPISVSGSPDIIIESAGDVIITPSINWGTANVGLHLLGSGTANKLIANTLSTVREITMNGGDYSVTGKWFVLNDINFISGILKTPSATSVNDRIVYLGPDLGTSGNDNPPSALSYVSGPFFIRGQSGTITFPIGNASGFFPSQLTNVNDTGALFGMECTLGDPSIPADSLSSDIESVFTQWYWKLAVFSRGTFTGSPISLSLNNTDTFFGTKKPVIIEKDSLQYINDLNGTINNSFVVSTSSAAIKGIYALASSTDVGVKIHKIITPNGDGQNETLVIEGLDYYPANKVMLLDRWGAVYFDKVNFSNANAQTDFDYTKLNNGNYICTVQFTDGSGKTHKVKPQMISVIK